MDQKGFFDTCLCIALIFYINSLHSKSKSAFEHYSECFWSLKVQEEFNRRFIEKQLNLSEFFFDFQKLLENPEQEFFSISDLSNFVINSYSGKKRDDIKSSLEPFWNMYIGIESQIHFLDMRKQISFCLNDLYGKTNNNKKVLENIMQLIPPRVNKYSKIELMLKSNGVKDADRTIVLDGHDFACHCNSPVDFVTFDDECYCGAKNVKILCFNSIKGKDDFTAS